MFESSQIISNPYCRQKQKMLVIHLGVSMMAGCVVMARFLVYAGVFTLLSTPLSTQALRPATSLPFTALVELEGLVPKHVMTDLNKRPYEGKVDPLLYFFDEYKKMNQRWTHSSDFYTDLLNFENKFGRCIHYAVLMSYLARYCGLPFRYVFSQGHVTLQLGLTNKQRSKLAKVQSRRPMVFDVEGDLRWVSVDYQPHHNLDAGSYDSHPVCLGCEKPFDQDDRFVIYSPETMEFSPYAPNMGKVSDLKHWEWACHVVNMKIQPFVPKLRDFTQMSHVRLQQKMTALFRKNEKLSRQTKTGCQRGKEVETFEDVFSVLFGESRTQKEHSWQSMQSMPPYFRKLYTSAVYVQRVLGKRAFKHMTQRQLYRIAHFDIFLDVGKTWS